MGRIRICSIAPEEFKIQRGYSHKNALVIPACTNGTRFTYLDVEDGTDFRIIHTEYDASKAERIPVVIPAEEIVRDFFSNEQLALKGCFISQADTPTEDEITKALTARRAYLQKCVQDGDVEYARSGRVDEIPGAWKRYAEELGVEREWAFVAPKAMFDCPACGEKIRQGVAVCKSCGAILDKEKAKKFGLLQPEKGKHAEAIT